MARREHQKGGGEDDGDDRAAKQTLDKTKNVQRDVCFRSCAGDGRGNEPSHGGGEQPAGGHHAGQETTQRNSNDFGDQIGGLDIAKLVLGNGQIKLNIDKRASDDLNVEDRQKHTDGHGCKACPGAPFARGFGARVRGGGGHLMQFFELLFLQAVWEKKCYQLLKGLR
jgi:hypothetical protein